MTRTTMAAAAAMLLALTGCGGGEGANNQAGNQADNAAEAAPAANEAAGGKDPATAADTATAPAGAAGNGPSAVASSPSGEIRALLVGRWVEGGDCARATEIRDDGTFSSPAGSGRWTLESEYVTLSGAGPAVEFAVQEIDRSDMTTINPMGHIGRWTRC